MDLSFDTKIPLNINDDDIWPGMTEPPEERIGMTEMSFVLVRYEIGSTIRRLSYGTPGMLRACPKQRGLASVADKESKIEALEKHLHDRFLQYCDPKIPLHWVTYNVAKLVN